MIRAPWPSTLGQMRAVRPRAGRPARRAISMSPAVGGLEYLVGFVAGGRRSEIVLFSVLDPRPNRQNPRNVRSGFLALGVKLRKINDFAGGARGGARGGGWGAWALLGNRAGGLEPPPTH